MKNLLLILFVFLSLHSFAQNFGKLVDSTYDFSPHKLSDAEQQKQFPKLDTFFNLVMKDTATYLPLLKAELKKDGHFPYFYYDAAHLLMIINKDNTRDDDLIVSSFKKSDIRDLSPKAYTSLLTQLSLRGANTSDLALVILTDTTFSFFVPQHVLTFNQGYCVSYVLLPLDPGVYTTKLINAFDTLPDLSKESVITTLWFSYSCQGDQFLNAVKDNPNYSADVRSYAADLLSRKKIDSRTKKMMNKFYGKDLNAIWYNAFRRFSDEAIGEIDYVSRMRRENEACR